MLIKRIVPFAAALLIAAGAGTAFAKDRDGNQDARDAAAIPAMKLTLQDAITAAERQSGGRAVSADVAQSHGAARIAVELAGPQGVKTVIVDGQTGQVTAALADDQDHEDDD